MVSGDARFDGGRSRVIPSVGAGLEEMQQLEDFLADALASSEETLLAIRGAREDVELVASLLSDEKVVVDALVELLPGLSPLLMRVTVNPSTLPVEMGKAKEVRLTPDGKLIVYRLDGELKTTNLTKGANRDLLVEVMRDVVPKLKEVLDNFPVFLEPAIEKPEPVVLKVEEPTIEKPKPVALEVEEPAIQEPVVEYMVPEVPPEVEEPVAEEQQVEAVETPLGVEEPTLVEEPTADEESTAVEEPAEPEAFILLPDFEPVTIMEPAPEREPVISLPVADDELPRLKPIRTGDAELRVYRRRVKSIEEAVRRQMVEVRRRRDAEIRRLREGLKVQDVIEWEEPVGLFERLKRLFTRKRWS